MFGRKIRGEPLQARKLLRKKHGMLTAPARDLQHISRRWKHSLEYLCDGLFVALRSRKDKLHGSPLYRSFTVAASDCFRLPYQQSRGDEGVGRMTGRRRRGENNFTEGRGESYGVVRWALKRNAPVDSSSERAAKDHLVGLSLIHI